MSELVENENPLLISVKVENAALKPIIDEIEHEIEEHDRITKTIEDFIIKEGYMTQTGPLASLKKNKIELMKVKIGVIEKSLKRLSDKGIETSNGLDSIGMDLLKPKSNKFAKNDGMNTFMCEDSSMNLEEQQKAVQEGRFQAIIEDSFSPLEEFNQLSNTSDSENCDLEDGDFSEEEEEEEAK